MSIQFLKPAGPRFVTSQTDTPLKKKEQDSLVCLLYRSSDLYRSCRLAVRRIVSPGMGLPHQRAGGIFLCLGSLEKRETRLEVSSKPFATASPTMARWTQSTPHMPGC